ncbi:unnamed protein product [Caenorhabditis bovis]|uniref:Helicase ATP-binding domain-containing protein n=1 Tax=Caenorhabditis bovis TaxID=2654633 RepID=A0A8S1F3A5_9PELO|nr:unnamed protein product [Caenorhabditis bovis]
MSGVLQNLRVRIISKIIFCRLGTSSIQSSKKFGKKLRQKKTTKFGLPVQFHEQVQKWQKLIQIEIEAKCKQLEEAIAQGTSWEILEERNMCVANLIVTEDQTSPVLGRYLCFNADPTRTRFLKPGMPVTLGIIKENANLKIFDDGFVIDPIENQIAIKLKSVSSVPENAKFVILPSKDTGVMQNLLAILKKNEHYQNASAHLVNLAFRGATMPSIHDRKMTNLNENLNQSQVAAISASLNDRRPFLCIQGPPGTGKTRTIAEIVRLLINKNKKVLVCGPTHIAVANVMKATIRSIQQTPDGKASPEALARGTDKDQDLIDHPDFPKLENLNRELNRNLTNKSLESALNNLKYKMFCEIYGNKRGIFSTISASFIPWLINLNWFPDVLIVDEAAQCIEPAIWSLVLSTVKCKRLILVGDPQQLPPIVVSEEAKNGNLHVSLMERMMKEFANSNISVLLKEQYRMNCKIMSWSNENFYNSQLIAHESVANITLSDLYPDLKSNQILNSPLLMVNTENLENRSKEGRNQHSIVNIDEARIVSEYVHSLVRNHNVEVEDIAIIAPYYAQVEHLRGIIRIRNLHINTVDAFQGHEKQIVIFCLVRDNPRELIGFLRDSRRLNVAITRAKRQFVLIGSAKMMKKDPYLRSLLNYFKEGNVIFDIKSIGIQ